MDDNATQAIRKIVSNSGEITDALFKSLGYDLADNMVTALTALKGVAEGDHVIVPKEPTQNMIDMGGREIAFKTQHFGGARTLARYSSDALELTNRKRAYAAYGAMLTAYEGE